MTRVRPWFLRAIEATPLPAPFAAGAFAALLLAYNLGLLQFAPSAIPDNFHTQLLFIYPVAIFYVLAAGWLALRGARRDLHSLRSQLACSDAQFELLDRSITHFPRSLMVCGVAVAVAFVGSQALHEISELERGPGLLMLPVGLEALLCWSIMVSTALVLASNAGTFRRVGAEWLNVDLFDRRSLQPLVRVGLRLALVLLGVVGLRAAFFTTYAPEALLRLNALPLAIIVALATASLLLPVWGARTRIRAAKAAELDRVRVELDGLRSGGATPIDSGEGVPRALLNLLDYRAKVEAVREWPFDAPALLRFAAYLLIPVGGWIGGALMERLVDALVG